MHNKSLELWVGLFMLSGIVALVMLAVQAGSSGSVIGETYRIEARFENVGGLAVKAPVRIGGVRIGRVGAIRIDPSDYAAVVSLDIDAEYDTLGEDTGAAILTSGLLGAQFVGLSPGASDLYLESGDTLEFTQSAIQLESLIGQLMFNRSGQDEGR